MTSAPSVRRLFAACALCIFPFAATASDQEPRRPTSEQLAAIKAKLAAQMKDPGAVQWRDLYIGRNPNNKEPVVCGELNGKNSYGAYVGFKRFMSSYDAKFQAIDHSDDVLAFMIAKVCSASLGAI